jgi:hypothetical protein
MSCYFSTIKERKITMGTHNVMKIKIWIEEVLSILAIVRRRDFKMLQKFLFAAISQMIIANSVSTESDFIEEIHNLMNWFRFRILECD